jgi:photosystem II stability/assembly factor-like uncharacterized protein
MNLSQKKETKMKKMLTILVCALLATAAFGQWEAVRGPVMYSSYTDAIALDANVVLTVDDNIVMKSVDFGANWTEVLLPDGISSLDMDADGDYVVIVADDGFIYKSADAGDNWMQIGDTSQFTTDLHQVDVYDTSTYFVTGEDGLFMKTVDGGANWDTTVIDPAFDLDGAVIFTSALNGIAVQDGNDATYWRTTDGGDTWSTLALTWPFGTISKRLYSGFGLKGTNTMALVGYHNLIFLSTDGGATFAQSGDMSYGYDRHEYVNLFSEDSMLVVSAESNVLTTVDGGTTWDTTYTGTGQTFAAGAFSSLTHGIVFSGYGQTLSTTDGATFVPMTDWPGLSFWGLAFPGEGEVLISAYSGGELTYSADGETFSYPTNLASKTGDNIYELEMVGGDTVVMGGTAGLIKLSADKGMTWTDQIDNPMVQLSNKHINMLNYANGKLYAGGSSGMIMVSSDNGETWTELENTSSQTVYDMQVFSNGMAMLACNSGQFCVSTSTALDTFELVADYGTMAFRSIDERNGVVIVGAADDIYKTTTDALDTLVAVFDVPGGDDIYGVRFVNDSTVYAVGQDGIIFVSTDAGDNWTDMPAVTLVDEIDLQHCEFDGKYVWAVGKNGTILKHRIESIQADFSEEFTDGTADLTWMENVAGANAGGLNLTVVADSAGYSNVGVFTDDAYTGLLLADTEKKLKDYEVSADIYIVKEQDAAEALYKGLAIKGDPDSFEFYRFVYKNSSSSNGALKLQGFDGASWYISKQWEPGVDFDTLETGFHNFKAQVIDNKFWVYIDDMLLPGCPYSHSDPQVVSAGYPGIYKYTAGSATVAFDNFKVNVFEYPKYMVTANVDMGVMVRRGEFNPASSNLDIAGSFNGWTSTPMTDTDADTIYTAAIGEHEAGTTIEFKCRRNGAWDNTEEFPYGGAAREYVVTDDGDQVIPTFLYNDVTEVAIEGVPAEFALEQNYPNPFNPATTVKFQIPNAEMVTMSIYNVAGQKVAELVNRQLEAGYYSVNFDASVLPSGMYIYRLNAGAYTSVKKMTLLK